MSKHTPAPWRFGVHNWEKNAFEEKPFDYAAPGYYDNPEIVGPNGESVVGCDEYCVFGSEANARLIASAPDLLEALKRLSDQCDRMRLPGQHMTDAEESAKTAITKATGESK